MDNTKIEADSQSNRSSFRTIYKDRSNKSLREVKRKRLLDRIGQHSSLKKLQTKLEVAEVVNQKPMEVQQPAVKNTLEKLNFSHHNPEQCLCGSCECGRHLCKFKIVRPDIHKKTSYEQHFPLKIPTKSFMLIQPQTKLMKSQHVDLSTVYKNEFNNSLMEKIVKPKPVDTLKEEGPLQSLTVYRSNFKDFKVPNQYVKHTDKHTRDNFPFRSKSVYSKEFTEKTIKRHRSLKSTDQISLGKMWLGQSTYNLTFQKPKNSLLDPIPKHIEKMNQTLNDKLRFRTNYKTDYVLKSSPLCPSKAELQQKARLAGMKHTFAENAEFKSMSPQFHAISTSKHFYV